MLEIKQNQTPNLELKQQTSWHVTSTGTASDAESSSHALRLEPESIARFLVGLGWTWKISEYWEREWTIILV